MTSDPVSSSPVTSDPVHDRAVRRFVLVALVLPAVLTAVAVTIQLIALPHVPSTIAVHWNAAGRPDGFAPAWLQPLVTVAFGFGVPALIALTSLPGLRRGDRGATFRLMGALAAATSMLLTVALTWTFVMQAGLDSAGATPSVWPALVAALVGAVGVGVLAWFLQPKEDWSTAPAPAADPLALGDAEHAVWLRTVSIAPGAAAGLATAVLLVAGSAVVTWFAGAPAIVAWSLAALALLLLVLVATTVAFHVRVDAAGVAIDSVLGLPRLRVPLDDVASAARVIVNPMGEFGGWGLRLGAGRRFGVVLRAGEALEVTRRSGKRLVVTVDDAGTAAALLEALLQRARR